MKFSTYPPTPPRLHLFLHAQSSRAFQVSLTVPSERPSSYERQNYRLLELKEAFGVTMTNLDDKQTTGRGDGLPGVTEPRLKLKAGDSGSGARGGLAQKQNG